MITINFKYFILFKFKYNNTLKNCPNERLDILTPAIYFISNYHGKQQVS